MIGQSIGDPGHCDAGFKALLRSAAELEALVRSRTDLSEADTAEGYLYIAGLLRFHLERALKGSDTDRPRFVRDMDDSITWGLPSPDHHYYSCEIDPEAEYRILGSRGATVSYCFEMLTQLPGDDGAFDQRVDALDSDRLQVDGDGRFEIRVGGEPRDKNWLRTDGISRTIFVRQTVNDWALEQPTPILIERVGISGGEKRFVRPSNEQVQATLGRAATTMTNMADLFDKFSRGWTETLPVNALPAPTIGAADANYFPGQYNTKCRFKLCPDEALLLTLVPSTALYQSLTLAHALWFNSLYSRDVQSSLSGAQSRVSSDGLYRFVISATDPGVPNWLDTCGRGDGFLMIRWLRIINHQEPQQPRTKVVKLSAVRDEFPEDEPCVDEIARSATQRIRRLSSDRRYA